LQTPFSVLSLKGLNEDPKTFSQELGKNFRDSGFCGIKDHGIDTKLVTEVQDLMKRFFNLPEETKRSYFKPELNGARGYTPFKIETPKDANLADLKEFWHVGRELDKGDPFKQWMPENLDIPDLIMFKEKTNDLFSQFDELGKQLLEAIALDLNLNSNFFHNITNKGNSVMRIIHYPPVDREEKGERAGAHEDINLITLLIGGQQAGLEILSRENEWLRASVSNNVIICNIGDMLQRLTNNNLKSTTHRVKAIADEAMTSRYSIPFFVHPNPDWFIQTLESQINESHPNMYPKGILAEDFLQERLKEIKLM
tara:strand:- start:9305 stop:10237 length:933 start_codon:yes stop_codon:yes gene_type:complete